MVESLCRTCTQCRVIVSGRGSTFLLCRKSQDDQRYPKYPPQPVVRCEGYEAEDSRLKAGTTEMAEDAERGKAGFEPPRLEEHEGTNSEF